MQLWLWMISLTTGRSGDPQGSGASAGGGARPMLVKMGLMGDVMSPRLGSNLWMHRESGEMSTSQLKPKPPGAQEPQCTQQPEKS